MQKKLRINYPLLQSKILRHSQTRKRTLQMLKILPQISKTLVRKNLPIQIQNRLETLRKQLQT